MLDSGTVRPIPPGSRVEHHLVTDIATCIIAAWIVAVACQAIRQPLLLAYLLAGFAIGPNGFRWVTDAVSIQTISQIGLILLLFMIGLEMDLRRMISAGRIITLTAAAQILGCVALGWLFFGFVGLATGWLEALYSASRRRFPAPSSSSRSSTTSASWTRWAGASRSACWCSRTCS